MFEVDRHYGRKPRTPWERVVALADQQWGHVRSEQLPACGVTRDQRDHWLQTKRLRLVHRGVYAVGHIPQGQEPRFMAAVLAVPGVALSHLSAAWLWRMIELIVPEVHVLDVKRRAPRKGIEVHPTRRLRETEFTYLHRIPVTTPARTLIDLTDVVRRDWLLRRAVNEAFVRKLLTPEQLRAAMAATPGRHATARLTALLAAPTKTRSGLEDLAYDLLIEAGVPAPETNESVLGEEADLYWPEHGLIVEVDGDDYHSNPIARGNDQRKQAHWEEHGLRVLRVGEEQAADRRQTARRVAAALADAHLFARASTG